MFQMLHEQTVAMQTLGDTLGNSVGKVVEPALLGGDEGVGGSVSFGEGEGEACDGARRTMCE